LLLLLLLLLLLAAVTVAVLKDGMSPLKRLQWQHDGESLHNVPAVTIDAGDAPSADVSADVSTELAQHV
jgi:hypothetical protein